jgi:hypothetical protein
MVSLCIGGCGAYDANSLRLPVTCADAPESNIQFEPEVSFTEGARFEIPSSVCARLIELPEIVALPLSLGLSEFLFDCINLINSLADI